VVVAHVIAVVVVAIIIIIVITVVIVVVIRIRIIRVIIIIMVIVRVVIIIIIVIIMVTIIIVRLIITVVIIMVIIMIIMVIVVIVVVIVIIIIIIVIRIPVVVVAVLSVVVVVVRLPVLIIGIVLIVVVLFHVQAIRLVARRESAESGGACGWIGRRVSILLGILLAQLLLIAFVEAGAASVGGLVALIVLVDVEDDALAGLLVHALLHGRIAELFHAVGLLVGVGLFADAVGFLPLLVAHLFGARIAQVPAIALIEVALPAFAPLLALGEALLLLQAVHQILSVFADQLLYAVHLQWRRPPGQNFIVVALAPRVHITLPPSVIGVQHAVLVLLVVSRA
jgi:hypothetical protein